MLAKLEYRHPLWIPTITPNNKNRKPKIKLSIIIGVNGCNHKEYWKEMSYSHYNQSLLDFEYDEYSNGNWHWE